MKLIPINIQKYEKKITSDNYDVVQRLLVRLSFPNVGGELHQCYTSKRPV
ncbi:hypothetical protein ADICYQ_0894 [Cyclobacterium qasimii M12-11B]|uniref:Uncharacterized protein n=1 Tax=Cyclobacterium qasimii M12-11B TaxID=641524 RepID=S7X465_9BACT|nr:hypothetical protein ADICYQ_0894 [Cyclobacterium qasimii M12-11B]